MIIQFSSIIVSEFRSAISSSIEDSSSQFSVDSVQFNNSVNFVNYEINLIQLK